MDFAYGVVPAWSRYVVSIWFTHGQRMNLYVKTRAHHSRRDIPVLESCRYRQSSLGRTRPWLFGLDQRLP